MTAPTIEPIEKERSTRPTLLVRLADWSYRRRRLVVLLWIVLLVGTTMASGAFGGEYDFTFSTPGSESQEAQDLLEDRFPARSGDEVDVVFQAADGRTVDDPEVRAAIESALVPFSEAPHVDAVESPLSSDPEAARQIAPERTIAYAILRLDVTISDYELTDARTLIDLGEELDRPEVQIELAGFPLQGAEQAEFSSEGIGLLLAALILLVSFGSLLAMGLPILIAVVGLGIGLSLITLIANLLEVPDFAPQVAAMIGIGVGIDYVLFIVTRYRSALHEGLEPRAAVITAITTSGRAVIFAGCTVIISLLGLFVMNLGFLRGLAVGAVAAVLVVMLASVTLLPAMLGFVGRTIDRLRVPFVNRKLSGDRTSLSYRWSRVVQRFPWPAALICFVGLLALATPALDMRFGFPDASNSSTDFTTRRAYDLLERGFGAGFNGPLLLVARAEGETDLQGALAPVAEELSTTEGVAFVSPPIPSPDGDVALLVTYPTSSPQAEETEQLVNRLRDDVLPGATEGTGLEVFVGGSTGASVDATRYVADRLALFIGAVIVLSFLLLLVVFRSILVPLKAAIMNLLSVGAAYGVVAVAVQGGWLGGLVGIDEPVPVPSFIPMMMFAILFGLSMDYEVFLLSRIREEYSRTGDNAAAVADGLAHTARVITAAAAIMISVFLAFVLADEVFLKMLGIGLATAIFVDATIVRMVLVPATMELLGDANWWLPAGLARRLPQFHVEGESAEAIEAELEELLQAEQARSGERT
ncbi:MAG: MMPL family transporter [Actinomycetota bacterium]|nr:MMPL family transporter [Actinomycetota bacterium]